MKLSVIWHLILIINDLQKIIRPLSVTHPSFIRHLKCQIIYSGGKKHEKRALLWSKWLIHLKQMAYLLVANGLFTLHNSATYASKVAEFFQEVAGLIHHYYSEFARIIYFTKEAPSTRIGDG